MAELLRIRCSEGRLIITDQAVRVELGQLKQQSLARASLSSIDSMMAFPNIFGLGRVNLTFRGQGTEQLKASMIPTGMAKEIRSLLGLL